MSLLSTIHQLKSGYPQEDTYEEIVRTETVPGGEAANGAILLAKWGLETQLDGTHLGSRTRQALLAAFGNFGVDCSLFNYDPSFDGWKDIVLCGGGTRTVFGWFQALFSSEEKHWNEVNREAVAAADVVVLDPFFGESSRAVAEAAMEAGTPFVSVDAAYDDVLATGAAAIVVSGEYRDQHYAGFDKRDLLNRYVEVCSGLVVFTSGEGCISYAKDGEVRSVEPYSVEVVDTLAAGDSFRAGVAYAVAQGYDAETTVRYGASTAALVCGRFPSIHPVPSLEEVEELVRRF
ncbi:kinase, pfkB family [Verrucomicrobiia bacterium DG1235]|nr:kinase, pfkB family [Verrucomicrobiae bacterium DG1235]